MKVRRGKTAKGDFYNTQESYNRDTHWHAFVPPFCESFKRVRKECGLEPIEIARALNKKDLKVVNHWEDPDDPRFPNIRELDFICVNLFHCEIDDVLGYTPAARNIVCKK